MPSDIAKLEQRLAKNERLLALAKIKQRKVETRQKIQLGGLVVKANMAQHSKAVILGALIEAAEALERNDEGILELYRIKGEAAFLKDEQP